MSEMPDVTDPSSLQIPTDFSFNMPGNLLTTPINLDSVSSGGSTTNLIGDIANSISKATQAFYGTQAQIAQQQAALAVAKAQGNTALLQAQTGLPSTSTLLLGGVALAALYLITKPAPTSTGKK